MTVAAAGMLALGGLGIAQAQDATPTSDRSSISAVGMINPDGLQIGIVAGSEFDGMVELSITAGNIPPGEHGLHIHETGVCDPAGDEPFSSAGEHFNPAGTVHGPGQATVVVQVQEPEEGTPAPEPVVASPVTGVESHAGDLGNITVDESGRITVTATIASDILTLVPGAENLLADEDGSALLIHEMADDLMTDPSGDSGGRIACAVLFAPASGAPAASPEA